MFSVRYAHVPSWKVEKRIIFNPNYGGLGCQVPGTCIIKVVERKIKPKFFEALRASVEAEGFRNPITLYNTQEGLLLSFGGSRLRVAKELRILVPAIIVDYVGTFRHDSVVTADNYEEFYRDPPVYFEWTDTGIETHYSLERLRREYYDPAGMEWTHDYDGDKTFIEEEFPWLINS
jgi:hypothetical protein